MSEAVPNGRPGNRIFNDRTIALWLAGCVAIGFGVFQSWELTTLLDVRDRMTRVEALVFPPSGLQFPFKGSR